MTNKSRKKHHKVDYNGYVYNCTAKGGKVSVRVERTARGQNLLAGTFDIAKRTWQNESRTVALPTHVRKEVEKNF